MKPNRFEWLDEERQRVAWEGTGARYVSYLFAQNAKRSNGIALAMLPIIFILQALPRTPGGPVEPRALLLAGIVLAAFSIVGLRWLKPARLVSKWALWTTFGMGCLVLLMGLLT